MKMAFAEFEIAPERTLSAAQEKTLARKYLCGEFAPGSWKSIQVLIRAGYLETPDGGKTVSLTEKGSHYCFHHGIEMPV